MHCKYIARWPAQIWKASSMGQSWDTRCLAWAALHSNALKIADAEEVLLF